MTSARFPDFSTFFEALHGARNPFPWQVRLAAEVLDRGWPELLNLPTGVGKTTAMDVALYCLAAAPDRMPRRTLLVVDRRIVVDQGAVHARDMLKKLHTSKEGPLKVISDVLRGLHGASQEEAPFAVAVMRGGMPRDNDWAKRPDQPVLGVSTVDQVGSRLLFRGYGVGPMSASIHAGLLANDTLILLDEVHLAVPFAQTLDAIRTRFRRPVAGLPNRFAVVRMSATPGHPDPTWRVLGLGQDDRNNPILAKRLSARKQARLVSVKVTGDDEAKKREILARAAVREALELQKAGAKVIAVVVNRVDTARSAMQMLKESEETTDRLLLTGRMRPIERDHQVRAKLLPRAGAETRVRSGTERPLIVVATQCIEAGADLDFDGLVTECASLDALRQRFGRVDRRGELGQSASVILGRSDGISEGADDPVYGTALAATWTWLQSVVANDAVDFGVDALPTPVDESGRARADLTTPIVDAPIMLPAHLDSWAQTSQRPSPDHDISLWLHGSKKAVADVQVVWRVGIAALADDLQAAIDQMNACRPSSLEAVTVPLGALRRWLSGEAASAIADVVSGDAEGAEESSRRKGRSTPQASERVFRWEGEDSERVEPRELRPGDVIVLDVSRGGLTDGSFDPEGKSNVTDLGDLAQLRGRGVASLRLDPEALVVWSLPTEVAAQVPIPTDDDSRAAFDERLSEWFTTFPDVQQTSFPGTPGEWEAARRALSGKKRRTTRFAGGSTLVFAPVARGSLVPEFGEAFTEDEGSAFCQVQVTLKTHSGDVRDYARRFSESVGFDAGIASDVSLAAWLHDVGKADPRFQRWLLGGSEVQVALLLEPLAKSALPSGNREQRRQARVRAGYPAGYRHELLSLEMLKGQPAALAKANDRDLVLHLVASHHGWCRPFAPAEDDGADFPVALQHGDESLSGMTRHRLSRLDSGVSDRFWALIDRYGWWGLAWLEAVLRLADHRASEMESEGAP